MNIKLLSRSELVARKVAINTFLSSVFDDVIEIDFSPELFCGVTLDIEGEIIGTGFVYIRVMQQDKLCFNAGIVGGIAVSPDWRGKGLSKRILKQLDNALISNNVSLSFLFAYEPKIYYSSGYCDLQAPIHYYDKDQKRWNQFVYRGGMVKLLSGCDINLEQVIEFNGSVY